MDTAMTMGVVVFVPEYSEHRGLYICLAGEAPLCCLSFKTFFTRHCFNTHTKKEN